MDLPKIKTNRLSLFCLVFGAGVLLSAMNSFATQSVEKISTKKLKNSSSLAGSRQKSIRRPLKEDDDFEDDAQDDQEINEYFNDLVYYHADGERACSNTTAAALRACRNESKDDYWVAVAKCHNLADPAVQEECYGEAQSGLKEKRALCRVQKLTRSEVCNVLGEAPYDPVVNPEEFVDFKAVVEGKTKYITNEYFPLVPGTTRIYSVTDAGGDPIEEIKVEVLKETKEILGVNCIVVRDRVWEIDQNGEKQIIEDTIDWFGQDLAGNVWYFGEIVQDFDDGELVAIDGSFKAGRDFDKAGFIMLAVSKAGDLYRQEFSLGNAEDMAEVIGYVKTLKVGNEIYMNVLKINAFNPLDPGSFEHKYYAPGVGAVLEENIQKGERVELIEVINP